jgi:hypothetical protein
MKTSLTLFLCLIVAASAREPNDGYRDAFGPSYQAVPNQPLPPRHGPRQDLDSIRSWNEIAINAAGLDHTPVAPGENRVFGEQLGPCRSSRAMAIVHIAMFDAVVAVFGGYESYTGVQAPKGKISAGIAASQAALDAALAEDLAAAGKEKERTNGIELGKRAAAAILALKAADGSQHVEPRVGVDYFPSNFPGHWRQDPVSLIPLALGGKWGHCVPFVLESGDQFRIPPPPALDSTEYAAAYEEAKRLGGDGVVTSTARTPEQTEIGTYWAYDGTPSLCAPQRLYNQIALQIADQVESDDVDVARLLALVNVAMADAGIAVWDSKYFYEFWRPITGIRESDPGAGPTGLGDGNPATVGDPAFSPLGAPASNLSGPNFTPPFPAYPSGHAGFGGALFQTLRRFYGTDRIRFTFVSDEFNGVTKANDGTVRPLIPRTFSSLSQAEEENGQSRIYLGIHWSFDKTRGIAQGRQVGDYVFDHVFRPVPRRGGDR